MAKFTFFAYGHGAWGKAETLAEAVKLAKQHAWNRRDKRLTEKDFTVTVYGCDPAEVTVDDFATYYPEGTVRVPLWEARKPKK